MWTREQTQEWLIQVESRIEDIGYYLARTTEWCDRNEVWSDHKVIACSIVTVIWVCNMRGETISRREIFEILGCPGWEEMDDTGYGLNNNILSADLEDILAQTIEHFD